MDCDCPQCKEEMSWRAWLEDEPGPWATAVMVLLLVAALWTIFKNCP